MDIGAPLLIAIFVPLSLATFLWLPAYLNQRLAVGLRNRLVPGEEVVFESSTTRNSLTFPFFMFSLRQGYLTVTDRRLLFGSWVLARFWRTISEIPLRDVDDLTTIEMFRIGQVQVTINGERTLFLPRAGRWSPFNTGLGERLAKAIKRGKASGI